MVLYGLITYNNSMVYKAFRTKLKLDNKQATLMSQHAEAGHFIGTTWDWLSWQSLLVALTLIQGYILIGSTYLVWKTTGELQATHYRTAKIASCCSTTSISTLFSGVKSLTVTMGGKTVTLLA